MLASALLISGPKKQNCPFTWEGRKAIFDIGENNAAGSFEIEISFSEKISSFRRHDYTWQPYGKADLAEPFAPKILRLSNGTYVQPNALAGYWVPKDAHTLRWLFNPEGAAPVVHYAKGSHAREILRAKSERKKTTPALLFTVDAVEFSRSAIPFSATACFTDHCDFDTPENLVVQREFFKSAGIRVTKGFFLNHFSKRADNASFERDAGELDLWREDGHELAYHSLSQSIKSDEDSFADFTKFAPPFPDIPTWIDHGYQPYNLTLYRNHISDEEFASTMRRKGISILWNYIDSGTAAKGVINQLNPNDFTLSRFQANNRGKFVRRFSALVKAIMFHHYADEKIVQAYKNAAGSFKRFLRQKRFSEFRKFLGSALHAGYPVGKAILAWPVSSTKTFKLARFTPLVFTHCIDDKKFHVFQTLEMVDFRAGLSRENIDRLVSESGIFIAHTYFSVPHGYHTGRMLREGKIDVQVAENFRYLGREIGSGKIWNPTLRELVQHLALFDEIAIDVNDSGKTVVRAPVTLHFRKV